jgi:hypothetical protein
MMRKMQNQLPFSLLVALLKIPEVVKCKQILFIHIHIYAMSKKITYIFATLQEVYILVEVQHVTGISILPFQRLNHITLGTKEQKNMFLSYFFLTTFHTHRCHRYTIIMYRMQDESLLIEHPVEQDDSIEIEEPKPLQQQSLAQLQMLDPFQHSV